MSRPQRRPPPSQHQPNTIRGPASKLLGPGKNQYMAGVEGLLDYLGLMQAQPAPTPAFAPDVPPPQAIPRAIPQAEQHFEPVTGALDLPGAGTFRGLPALLGATATGAPSGEMGPPTEAAQNAEADPLTGWLYSLASAISPENIKAGASSIAEMLRARDAAGATESLPLSSSEERGAFQPQSTSNLGPYDPLSGDPIVGGNQPAPAPIVRQPQLQATNPSNVTGQHPPWIQPPANSFGPPRDMRAPQNFPFEVGGRAGTSPSVPRTAPSRFGGGPMLQPSNYARDEASAAAMAQPGGRPVFGTAPSGRQVFSANRLPETDSARALRDQLAAGQRRRDMLAQQQRRAQLSAQAPSGPQGPRKEDYLDIAQMFDGNL